ncbi:MAG: hypothetical protein ABI699_12455 [Caldimonas sp.]
MANDGNWVEDVKRWYLAGVQSAAAPDASSAIDGDGFAIGYEAAHPALQARHWPDSSAEAFADSL